MILPISSWDDLRVSFLLSCLASRLLSRFSDLLSRLDGSAFLLFLSLGFCLSLMILPMESALVLDLDLSLLDLSLSDLAGADLAGADLLAAAFGAALAFGAAWAILLHANSKANAIGRRSR